jgi:GT2 family glycosyltransferase
MPSEKLSVCIVTYNSAEVIGSAVSSIKEHTKGIDYRIYISDNASGDNTIEKVAEIDDAKIIQNGGNIGFGKAHNAVIPLLDSKYHAVVNPDIRLDCDVLTELCEYLDSHEDAVMVTPKVLFPNGEEQVLPKRKPTFKYLLGRRLPFFKDAVAEYTRANETFSEPTEIDFCTGCFFVMRTEVFKKLGGFDDRFFMYFEDADITLRAKEHGKVLFIPSSHVIHCWERSSSKSLKYLMIHISSMFKFLWKHRKTR